MENIMIIGNIQVGNGIAVQNTADMTTFRWFRNNVQITGTMQSDAIINDVRYACADNMCAYLITEDDINCQLSCEVTYSNGNIVMSDIVVPQ